MRIDNAIRSIQPGQGLGNQELTKSQGEDFGKLLTDALKEVNQAQKESRSMQNDLMANQPVDIDDLMMTMEKASIAMQLTMQVRNKLLEAYQEVSRMQV